MNMEISEDFSASNDQVIVKGKRTKRLRPSSSTSSSGGGEINYNSSVSSPATSTSTEEDEDMANCLILLARGGFSSQTEEEIKPSESKFSSRKFTEMATTTNGKAGIYVYECKTCSRTFPSFQALGGHRASHKKPKPAADVDQKISHPAVGAPPPEDQQQQQEDVKFSKINAMISTTPPSSNKIYPKIHECSICGAEFASGQALGGHMRRHRSANNSVTTNTIKSTNDSSSSQDNGEKTRNVLSLDLNLPAPPEDDHRETKFHQFSSNQQPHLVFSNAAPLVDCHY
ncbi:hypothetical protein CDL12_23166 [Handroanthus impetiginosus]|uniref:C2H2-type domain-containing protein n=1 Tax=Handroanthus impetiginosus TaxID=429701 RepID=A0A2G9GGH4_9LAMI|nr:hypothetical protein CDL12_23166 [Handroanthus impetiginosus]